MLRKINGIQYLRGLFAIVVVLYHWSGSFQKFYTHDLMKNFFAQGYLGVDLFFLISGFVIFLSTKSMIDRRDYFIRRFSRVLPVYWIALVLLIGIRFLAGILLHQDFFHDFSVTYLLRNVFLFPSEPYIIGPAWSLTYEVAFYIFFAIFCLGKKESIVVLAGIIGFLGLNFLAKEAGIQFFPRSINFLFGIFAAVLYGKPWIKNCPKLFYRLLLTALLIYFFTFFSVEKNELAFDQTFRYMLLVSFPGALLILACSAHDFSGQGIIQRTLTILGESSYSIYIFHTIFLMVIIKVFSTTGISYYDDLLYGLTLVVSLVAICIFSSLFEKKIIKFTTLYLKMYFKSEKK